MAGHVIPDHNPGHQLGKHHDPRKLLLIGGAAVVLLLVFLSRGKGAAATAAPAAPAVDPAGTGGSPSTFADNGGQAAGLGNDVTSALGTLTQAVQGLTDGNQPQYMGGSPFFNEGGNGNASASPFDPAGMPGEVGPAGQAGPAGAMGPAGSPAGKPKHKPGHHGKPKHKPGHHGKPTGTRPGRPKPGHHGKPTTTAGGWGGVQTGGIKPAHATTVPHHSIAHASGVATHAHAAASASHPKPGSPSGHSGGVSAPAHHSPPVHPKKKK